jgi:prepilin-type N-terminal cleavage/methylation domain-containing protein
MRLSCNSKSASDFGLRRLFVIRHSSFDIGRGAFTLIELILVMAILTIVISLTAPALANFFRGRTLDSEARRLLALTRQGQSRAVSEGIPMELWMDTTKGTFGLEAEPSYEAEDPKAVELGMDGDIQFQVTNDNTPNSASSSSAVSSSRTGNGSPLASRHPNVPKIRFLPDGSISETSPRTLLLTGRDGISICLRQSRNRLSYEITPRTN